MGRAKKRSRRQRKSQKAISPYDQGTPETRKRLERETLKDRLIRQGRIDLAMERAWMEIEAVYAAITRDVHMKRPSLERIDGSRNTDLSDWLIDAYQKRYKPWAEHLARLRDQSNNPAHQLTIDLIIDGWKVSQAERARDLPRGSGTGLLCYALRLYVVHAGWQKYEDIKFIA